MSGQITALQVQKRNPQRLNVYLDGEFAFGLSRLVAAWLRVGQVLSDEKIAQLQIEDEREVAHQHALRLLERRERSAAEIRQSLVKHQYSAEVIDQVLERLSQSGLVNDERFAQLWVENQSQFRPRSRKALAYEMRQRGIATTAIEQALNKITTEDEEELAYQAACKQARKLKNLDWKDFRVKLGGFLARRGFSYEVSAPAIQRTWETLRSQHSENLLDVDSTTDERD
jgi:regulatory protein